MISYATAVSVFLFLLSCSSLAFPELKLRELCYNDDIFLSFEYWLDDSVPYCSSILSISDSTTFVGSTKSFTTTISTVTTTNYDTLETVTIPQVTAFATISTTNGKVLLKRQENVTAVPIVVAGPPIAAPIPIAATATADNPIVSKFPSIAQNSSIAAEAYSACSCLRITPSTVTATPSILLTRTIEGIDYEALGTTTVTNGTTTLSTTATELPLPIASHNVPNSTVATIPNFPASARPFPTLNITNSVSAGIFPNVNATANSIIGHPMPTFNFTTNPTLPRSGVLPSPTGNFTVNSTLPRSGLLPLPSANSTANSTLPSSGFLPLPTVNLTTNFNASVSGRLPRPILNTTASGRLPLPPVNATGRPMSPVTGFLPLPTFNGTNRTLPVPTGVNIPLSGRLPFPTMNATRPSVRIPLPTLNSTSLPAFVPTGTAPSFSASGQPRFPFNISALLPTIGTATTLATSILSTTNISTTSTAPFEPVGTQISPLGCPSINNTIYTTPTVPQDRYQLQCAVAYTGLAFADLDEPDLEGCIEKCSNINTAFSEEACYGVSFLQYNAGLHCILLAQEELTQSAGNPLAISAVLLNRPVVRA